MNEALVTPDTRIGTLLSEHPELEAFLAGLSPRFAALKNPVMRRTVGRVATVAQAAAIAGMSTPDLVMALRRELGQPGAELPTTGADAPAQPRPEWVETAEPAVVLDADELITEGQAPVNAVRQRLAGLGPGQILLLEVSFKPEPLIEAMRRKDFDLHAEPSGRGWRVWLRNA